jgi:hypothetical protein
MVAALVLSMLLAILLTQASVTRHRGAAYKVETQAYYTARSGAELVVGWIQDADDAKAFLDELFAESPLLAGKGEKKQKTAEVALTEEGNGIRGKCTVTVSYPYPDDPSQLTVTSVGVYAGTTETVTVSLNSVLADSGAVSTEAFPSEAALAFDPFPQDGAQSKQQEKADMLNNLSAPTNSSDTTSGANPVLEGHFYDLGTYVHDDSWDAANIAGIAANDMSREAKWERFWTDASVHWPNPNVLETFNWGADNGSYSYLYNEINYLENGKTFLVPANGRITFNPLRNDGYGGSDHDDKGEMNNTRLVGLAVSGTAGKDVYLRLGGDMQNVDKYNSYIGIDFVDQQTGDDVEPNESVEYLPNNMGVNVELGYATATVNKQTVPAYYTSATPDYDTDLRRASWYPQNWRSGTIFTQASGNATINDGLDARLLIGPFHHGYETGNDTGYFDYWDWGSYVSNPNYGQSRGDAYRAFPEYSEIVGRNKRGMPTVPVYYGYDFDLYLLDNVGTTADQRQNPAYKGNLAWIQQGVSILNRGEEAVGGGASTGTICSTRGLTIGGMERRTSNWTCADDGVNINYDGWIDDDDPRGWVNALFGQARYGTLIYNTDIVLATPDGVSTPRTSSFNRALNYLDQQEVDYPTYNDEAYKFWRKNYSYYYPKTKIVGGRVYVGAGQTLTVQGGTQLYNRKEGVNYTVNTKEKDGVTYPAGSPVRDDLIPTGEYNMLVAPDSVTVAAGATMIIEASENVNVDTDIYVNGGTLVIMQGAKIRGTVWCVNGGVVDIRGAFQMDGRGDAGTDDAARGGIVIFSNDVAARANAILGRSEDDPSGIVTGGTLLLPACFHPKNASEQSKLANFQITGSAGGLNRSPEHGSVHLLGSITDIVRIAESGTTVAPVQSDYANIKSRILCQPPTGKTSADGRCEHYPTERAWSISSVDVGGVA